MIFYIDKYIHYIHFSLYDKYKSIFGEGGERGSITMTCHCIVFAFSSSSELSEARVEVLVMS